MASIREAATRTLQKVAAEFGQEWTRDHLVPSVLALIKNPHYLYRMTVLGAISMLASIVGSDVLCNLMLPVLTTAAKDKVRASQGGSGRSPNCAGDACGPSALGQLCRICPGICIVLY